MIFYQIDYVVDEILKSAPTPEQIQLKKYLNEDFSQQEAKYLWERIIDHKWYVSERLGRDLGFRAAAIDYVENFYQRNSIFGRKKEPSGVFRKIFRPINSALRSYFVSKSRILPQ